MRKVGNIMLITLFIYLFIYYEIVQKNAQTHIHIQQENLKHKK